MELSLFSRDVIALSAAVALTHDAFDAALMLGTCDKIVPGLMIGALSFGHLPILFSPAGPMPSGIPNKEKARVREQFALGQVSREQLLEAEAASYHTAGTCTFYGTANSNQMMMELMGVHLPGTAFVNPGTLLREALLRAAAARCIELAKSGDRPLAHVVDERSFVNALVGLMATGGSTNHALHIPAMAATAGIVRKPILQALTGLVVMLFLSCLVFQDLLNGGICQIIAIWTICDFSIRHYLLEKLAQFMVVRFTLDQPYIYRLKVIMLTSFQGLMPRVLEHLGLQVKQQ
jgi:hypothetical protein